MRRVTPALIAAAMTAVVSAPWALSLMFAGAAHAETARHTILLTHPRAAVLHGYIDMVQQHVLTIPNLHIMGIYHESETEDYQDAVALLAREHIDWITLHPVRCPLAADDMYRDNACVPVFRDLVAQSSGAVFNGGPDIPPRFYGEPTLLTTVIEAPHRHIFELSLLAHLVGTAKNPALVPLIAQRPNYAILGICVGMQSMNVADGGTLVQDIPSEIYGIRTLEELQRLDPNRLHRSTVMELDPEPGVSPGVFHPVRVASAAARTMLPVTDVPVQVFSVHHQAVGDLAGDYTVIATSLDGKVVEAISHKRFPNVLGLQFHPERPSLWHADDIQRRAAGDPDPNFAFHTLQRDPRSRAFNAAIWQAYGHAIVAVDQDAGPAAAQGPKPKK